MRVLSGMQPSGRLHLGNYFGSMLPNLAMANEADQSIFFIADLHALTTVQDPKTFKIMCREALLDYLAIGFDPEKTIIFFQSHVPAHTELAWLLMTVTPMGMLERAVSYKDKTAKGIAATAGLFTYPVLMTADILLYQADVVPVGKDQKQHVEMTRDIAAKFHQAYDCEIFTIPEPKIAESVAVVPGTDGQKMSKSYGNVIPLFGDEKEIKKAVMGIVTDSKDVAEKKDPETNTIYMLHKLFLSDGDAKELAAKYRAGGLGYGDAKKLLLDTAMDHFAEARARREKLAKDKKYVDDVILSGAAKARAIADATLAKARDAVGL